MATEDKRKRPQIKLSEEFKRECQQNAAALQEFLARIPKIEGYDDFECVWAYYKQRLNLPDDEFEESTPRNLQLRDLMQEVLDGKQSRKTKLIEEEQSPNPAQEALRERTPQNEIKKQVRNEWWDRTLPLDLSEAEIEREGGPSYKTSCKYRNGERVNLRIFRSRLKMAADKLGVHIRLTDIPD
jgi:hypothetical protein